MAGPKVIVSRLAKLAISFGVHAWDVWRAALRRIAGRRPAGTCVVLYYHEVRPEQRSRFARQMDELLRLSRPIPVDWRGALAQGQHHCAVTFDDGFVSVIENALPELEQRNIPSAMFVPSGSIGARPSWITKPTHPAFHEMVMTSNQLRALHKRKSMLLGSHSISHPNFLKLDEPQARRELMESRVALEEILGEPVRLFSFPHGKCSGDSIRLAKEAGYDRVFTIEPVFAFAQPQEFVTGRVSVSLDDWSWEFRLKVLGAYRWMARNRNGSPTSCTSVANQDSRNMKSALLQNTGKN